LPGFDFTRSDDAEECRVRFGTSNVSGVPAEWHVEYGGEDVFDLRVEQMEPLRPSLPNR
jgi:hypothetical protein